jgi:hypothetical protein
VREPVSALKELLHENALMKELIENLFLHADRFPLLGLGRGLLLKELGLFLFLLFKLL